ncbi:hypothetical protein JJC03_15420 [Flavobacterium oreochromis]|uniref:hypothetical protein n=1 Tax=Flavobacterium oreochromis TaxID=2906078 RepID=UPI001CE5FACC|nr:hypothetical protein [Flavobacterium oreochromis]QYS86295.1 hypothetical protein JJC03_15420 [Flavobacterium oreochromis]
MKRVFILCFFAIGMIAKAQTNQIITKNLQLNNVPAGDVVDKVLVRGSDKVVKEVSRSSIAGSPTIQQVLTSGNSSTLPINLTNASFSALSASNQTSIQGDYIMQFDFKNPSTYTMMLLWKNRLEFTRPDYTYVSYEDNKIRFWKSPSIYRHIDVASNVTGALEVNFPDASGTISLIGTKAPASSNSEGKLGEIRVTPTYIYVCTATNTWVRSALATW